MDWLTTFSKPILKTYEKKFRKFILAVQQKNETDYNSIINNDYTMALESFGVHSETLLHIVGRFGTPKLANHLIALGADVNSEDVKGRTPLYHASKTNTEIVKILINNGANINLSSCEFITPLHQVLLLGSVERLEILLNKPPSKNKKTLQSCSKAEKENCTDVLRFLLYNKTDLKLTKLDFPLLIFFAARHGDEEIFKEVMMSSKQFLSENDEKNYNNINIKRTFLTPTHFGRTALHYAVREQLLDVVQFLIYHGADINATTHELYTPLHYATALQNRDIIHILLSAGANANAKSRNGTTALHIASGFSHLRKLMRPGCGVHYDEHLTDHSSHFYNKSDIVFNPEIIKLLINNGANIESRGECGTTVFHEACRTGRFDLVKLFLQYGADPYTKDEENRTSLHHAAVGNNLDIVEFLLQIGLEVDAVNNFGCTPLFHLAQNEKQDRLEMLEFLVEKGADINARNKNYDTALHIAATLECLNVLELLLELKADTTVRNKENFSPLVKCFMATNNTYRLMPALEILIPFMTLRGDDIDDHYRQDPPAPGWAKVISIFDKCKLELEIMKKKKISKDRRLSFHDFLTLSFFKAVILTRNLDVMKTLESEEYVKEFPCYAFLLMKRIQRIKSQQVPVEKVFNFFLEYKERKLPTLVIEKILSFLCAGDFKNFEWALSG